MKRAPGFASADARLRDVDFARLRKSSSETRSKREASSRRLAAAISPRTPIGSATARLDISIEHLTGRASAQNLPRKLCRFLQSSSFARRLRSAAALRMTMSFRPAPPSPARSARRRAAFSAGSPPVTTFSGARSRPASSGLISQFADLSVSDSRIATRFTVQSDFVEAGAVDHKRLLDTHRLQGSEQFGEASSDRRRRAAAPAAAPD